MNNTTTGSTTVNKVDLYRTTYRRIGIFPLRWLWIVEAQYASGYNWYHVTSGMSLTKRAAVRRANRVIGWRKTASTTEMSRG